MNKAEINDKVSKVREVVQGVSNNDIILALHSFDFDVEKTIQAFCEDGASGVLDDWVRPAGSSSKKNKNKKKKAAAASAAQNSESQPSVAAPVQIPAPAAVPSASPAPQAAKPAAKPAPATAAPAPVPTKNTVPKAQSSSATSNSVQEAFKAIRAAINEREQALLSSYTAGSTFAGDVNHLISQIRLFGSVHDSSKPVVNQNKQSQQKSPSPVQTGIKHATSQSSISSSVGADSGVNLSPTHQEEKKPAKSAKVAQVASGGIQMASDSLSEDQLAALQRSLQEQLAARGIDANVLSGVTHGDMPVRSRQPRKPQERKNQKEGGKSARPQLSILNNA